MWSAGYGLYILGNIESIDSNNEFVKEIRDF